MAELLLASASPRRKSLLAQIGLIVQSESMDIDESLREAETPDAYVLRLAEEKACAGLNAHPDRVVLAADTTVVSEGKILGKPETQAEAERMLEKLSGSTHFVLTGIAVAKFDSGEAVYDSEVVSTEVSFLELSEAAIKHYVQSGEPMDKAGAYGIQGKAALFVKSIHGSYSNVVGLPLAETGALLERYGIPLWGRA